MTTYQIRDASPFSHFSMIPNIVDEMELSPYAFRLYGHLKRVTGESGACWQNTRELSRICKMSVGMISKAKKELMSTEPPLISVALTSHPQEGKFDYHEITIMDIWAENKRRNGSLYEQSVHSMNSDCSPHEQHCSPHEPKNTPIKKTPSKKKEVVPIPQQLSTPEFIELWKRFENMREEINRPLTNTARTQLYNKLCKYPIHTAIQATEIAIESNWRGIFPESIKQGGYTNGKAQASAPKQYVEEH